MVPCVDGVDSLAVGLLLQEFNKLLCDSVHAAHSRDHPDFVSYTYFAVLANESLEGAVLLCDAQLLVYRVVGVLQSSCKIGLEIILVHPFALLQVLLGVADWITVLDDVLSFGSIVDEHLMSSRSILQQGDGLTIYLNHFALLHWAQANHYRVGRVNLDKA